MKARLFAEENRKWWTLAAVAFGLFMIMLDNTVVNVALPAIQEDLGADLSQLQWIVTGYAPAHWVGANAGMNEMQSENPVPCREIAGLVARIPLRANKPTPVWGVELVGGPTDETALAAYRRLEQKYASILSGRDTYIVHHGLGRGMMGWAHVHVAADDRPSAAKLCADLRGAGVSYCEVQRARSAR